MLLFPRSLCNATGHADAPANAEQTLRAGRRLQPSPRVPHQHPAQALGAEGITAEKRSALFSTGYRSPPRTPLGGRGFPAEPDGWLSPQLAGERVRASCDASTAAERETNCFWRQEWPWFGGAWEVSLNAEKGTQQAKQGVIYSSFSEPLLGQYNKILLLSAVTLTHFLSLLNHFW